MRWNELVWRRTQAVILWSLGATGIANELFVERRPRPEALPLILALVGLPIARARDRARARRSPQDQP